MALVTVANATVDHGGTVCGGPVAGTVTVGSNSFVTIGAQLVMVEDGTFVIPAHNNPPCVPANVHGHTFTPDNFAQQYVRINGKKVVVNGDAYTGDTTYIDNPGSNSFVVIA